MSEITWTPSTVECKSDYDRSGCGAIWVEWNCEAKEVCPRCGRKATIQNIGVNLSWHPSVRDLKDRDVLVVFFEEEIK